MTTADRCMRKAFAIRRLRAHRRLDQLCTECREPAVSRSSCAFHLLLRRVRWRLRAGREPWAPGTGVTPGTGGRPPAMTDAELLDRLTPRQRAELRRAVGDRT